RLKYPAQAAEETAPGTVLGSEHADSRSGAQLIPFVKEVNDVETELQTSQFRQSDTVPKSNVKCVIGRNLRCVSKSAAQPVAIQHIGVDRRGFAGIRDAGRSGITLVMIQKNEVIRDKGQLIRSKEKLP